MPAALETPLLFAGEAGTFQSFPEWLANLISLQSPVGVFDSGVGGLPIARAIRDMLPAENLLYVADSGYAPYGAKTDAQVLSRTMAVCDFLVSKQVKAIAVACNTATTSCIATLRERYSLPIIGVEPGVKPAVLGSRTGVIGVLATPRTLETESFSALATKVAGHVKVELMPCPDLVAQVESLRLSHDEAVEVVARYVLPLLEKNADTIVLGCTHYVHLKAVISDIAGPGIKVISTEDAVAREVKRRLEVSGLLSVGAGLSQFWSSGEIEHYQRQIDTLWGKGEVVLPMRESIG